MIQVPGFRTILRGYDPTEVDRAIGDLIKARDQARSEAADNALARVEAETQLAQMTEQADAYRAQVAKAEAAPVEQPVLSASDIGARIGRMLGLAEDEANELRTQARAEAELLLSTAHAEVEQITGNAERQARDVVSKAETQAARILEAARRQSDEIVDNADRQAVARREEAEALYEAHRARAAVTADEVERTLAERQREADAEFAARRLASEDAIRELLVRQEGLEQEAEQATSRARLEAETVLRDARADAQQYLDIARAEASRVRAEARRELQETMSRRDSINAQLASVRNLLETLDVGTAPASPDRAPAWGASSAAEDAGDLGPHDEVAAGDPESAQPVPDWSQQADGEPVGAGDASGAGGVPAELKEEAGAAGTDAESGDVDENVEMAGSGQR